MNRGHGFLNVLHFINPVEKQILGVLSKNIVRLLLCETTHYIHSETNEGWE